QHLAADLVAFELLGRFPQDLISGERAKIGGLALHARQDGNAEVRAPVVTRLFASADSNFDPATDLMLLEQQTKLRLRPGAQRRVPLKLRQAPAGGAQGTSPTFHQVCR